MKKTEFNNALLQWFDANKRELPWRYDKTPYKVWVSEIMLQQTQVVTVIDYFNRFMTEFPTVFDLANAELDTVLKLWEGLGYYSRARNMKKTAIIIANQYDGSFPSDYKTLLTLPGIGPYTASAIMSIAFNKPYAAVDGNVYRVMARYLRIHESIKDISVKKRIKEKVESLIPNDEASDFTEALMELGATVCLPKTMPHCALCPHHKTCLAYKHNEQEILPVKQPKKPKDEQHKTIIVFVHENRLSIKKREDSLLNQLYGFYMTDGTLNQTDIHDKFMSYDIEIIQHLKHYTHTFTHIKWHIEAYLVMTNMPLENGTYVSIEDLESQYSLPRAFNKLLPQIKKALSSLT